MNYLQFVEKDNAGVQIGWILEVPNDLSRDEVLNAIMNRYRPKGKWTDSEGKERTKSKYCGHCSVCGGWSEYLTDFCGNCGADMRSEE